MRTLLIINKTLQTPHGRFRHGVIDKISEMVGVTPQTVRAVLRQFGTVSVSTKLKVLQAADAVALDIDKQIQQIESYERKN